MSSEKGPQISETSYPRIAAIEMLIPICNRALWRKVLKTMLQEEVLRLPEKFPLPDEFTGNKFVGLTACIGPP